MGSGASILKQFDANILYSSRPFVRGVWGAKPPTSPRPPWFRALVSGLSALRFASQPPREKKTRGERQKKSKAKANKLD